MEVINPTWMLAGEEKTKLGEQMDTLKELQGPQGDPVHLSAEGYFKLAAGILKLARGEKAKDGRKRKREESSGEEDTRPRAETSVQSTSAGR